MLRCAYLVALAVMAACRIPDATFNAPSDTGAADTGAAAIQPVVSKNGSRIKVRSISAADGFRSPQDGWFDSQLQARCTWAETSDGTRCVPDTVRGDASYLDASCQQPVVVYRNGPGSDPCAAPPSFFGVYDTVTCAASGATTSTLAHLYALGQPTTPAQIYLKSGTVCMAAPLSNAVVYPVGGELPLSTFVKATASMETGTGRFAHTLLTGDDGSVAVTGVYDTELGTSCALQLSGDHAVCAPNYQEFPSSEYSDAQCQSGVASATCPSEQFITTRDATCQRNLHVNALAAEVPATTLYLGNATTCAATTPRPGFRVQSIGAEVPVATLDRSFPTATRLVAATASAGGFAGSVSTIHDTALDIDCLPIYRGLDGVRRCMQPEVFVATLYSDPQCTSPLPAVLVPDSTCPANLPRFAYEYTMAPNTNTCVEGGPYYLLRVYSITSTTPIAIRMFLPGDAGCTAYDPSAYHVVAYSHGDEVPPTQFAEVEITVAP